MSSASRVAPATGRRAIGTATLPITRTSKPTLLIMPANDRRRPRDSSSMSKFSAPMIATPATASAARAL